MSEERWGWIYPHQSQELFSEPRTVLVLLGELWSDQQAPPSLRMDFRRNQDKRRTRHVSWVLSPLECEVRKSFKSGKKKSRESYETCCAGLL